LCKVCHALARQNNDVVPSVMVASRSWSTTKNQASYTIVSICTMYQLL
jgi:hypothetical protein